MRPPGAFGDRAEVRVDLVEVLGRGTLTRAVAEVFGHPLGQVAPLALGLASAIGQVADLALVVGHTAAFGWAGLFAARLLTLGRAAGLLTGLKRLGLLVTLLADLLGLLLRGLIDRTAAGLLARCALVHLLVQRIEFLSQ